MRWLALLAASIFLLTTSPATAKQTPDHVRLAVSPENLGNLALFLALDKGYFAKQNLDVDVVTFQGSAITQLVTLARGDVDVLPVPPAPGLFNLPTQGFNVKLVASLTEAHNGWNGAAWLLVRQDLWDSKAIRKPTDLRGKRVDTAAAGSPTDLLGRETLREAGLSPADLNLTSVMFTPPNWYAALRNHAVDVQAVVEPAATEFEQEGIAHKWISYVDSVPWFQDLYLAASPRFATEHHDVLRRFLLAVRQAEIEITSGGGSWNPTLLATALKWTKLPSTTLLKIPGPAYVGQLGTIDVPSLDRVQQYWVTLGLVKNPEDVTTVVDATALTTARKRRR